MSSQNTPGDGASVVARLLAGEPATAAVEALAEPWKTMARRVAEAKGEGRLAAYEASLDALTNDGRAADLRAEVERAGQAILRGQKTEEVPWPDPNQGVPDLPKAARIDPALERAGQEAGYWLNDYLMHAIAVSERTPPLFHEGNGLWCVGTAVARRLRLPLRHGDIYPNLYVLEIAHTSLYAKTSGSEVANGMMNATMPYLLLPSDFSPEGLLADLAGREPANLNSADMTQRDRELWLAGRNFAAQRGLVLEEASSLFAGLRRDYMAGIIEILLRLYDCPSLYRRTTRGTGFVVVRDAYLSILGMATPARLRGIEVATAWHDGLFARFGLLTPEAPPQRPSPDYEQPRPAYPPHLLETLSRLAHTLLPVPCYPNCAEVRDVEIADDAKAAWWRYCTALSYDLLTSDTPPPQELWANYARLPGLALKIGIILSAVDWAAGKQLEPRVTLPHYARAQGIAERWRASSHRFLAALSGRDAAAEYGREDQILRMVRAAGTAGIAARHIYRAMNLRRADFDLLVDGLTRDGLIRRIEIQSPRGPAATGFVASEYASGKMTG